MDPSNQVATMRWICNGFNYTNSIVTLPTSESVMISMCYLIFSAFMVTGFTDDGSFQLI